MQTIYNKDRPWRRDLNEIRQLQKHKYCMTPLIWAT